MANIAVREDRLPAGSVKWVSSLVLTQYGFWRAIYEPMVLLKTEAAGIWVPKDGAVP